MPRGPTSGPTELESQVLRLLWNDGECTVRKIHDWLVEQRGEEHRYTSTVKMLYVMLDKGFVDPYGCAKNVSAPTKGSR